MTTRTEPVGSMSPIVMAGRSARWVRPLAIATAAVFFLSLAFPVVAGLAKNTAAFPKWWGALDVGIALFLAAMTLAMMAFAERQVDRPAADATYRAYRVLIHGILVMTVVFMMAGDRIIWVNCVTGLGWRAWLLAYSLPTWFTALRITAAASAVRSASP